jgi:formate C-acetyltransferase
VEELKKAQANPERYRDLIVRLWGVSAHFVDLPKELQDEMIARFSVRE